MCENIVFYLDCLQFAVKKVAAVVEEVVKKKCGRSESVQNGRARFGATPATSRLLHHTAAFVYLTGIQQSSGRRTSPMYRLAFINLGVSVGYERISRHV